MNQRTRKVGFCHVTDEVVRQNRLIIIEKKAAKQARPGHRSDSKRHRPLAEDSRMERLICLRLEIAQTAESLKNRNFNFYSVEARISVQ